MTDTCYRGSQALARLLEYDDVIRVLDIGSGDGRHAARMREAGREVVTVSMTPPADYVGDYAEVNIRGGPFDAIWACHVLEHQQNVGQFLRRCFEDLREGGVLAITVPPPKSDIVGGHLALFNSGLLLYHLIVAGFDCSEARVSPLYADGDHTAPYNLSVIVRKKMASLPPLDWDAGDIDRLKPFFPVPVAHGFDGRMEPVNWGELPGDARPFHGIGHVAIVGLGPSAESYVDHVKRLGSRHKFADQVWAINGMGSVLDCDLVFHMDDVRIQEIRAAAKPDSNIAAMVKWLKTTRVPVITSIAHPDYPSSVEFPLEDVVNAFGRGYFNNTGAYALGYAIFKGARKISLFGCDYSYANSHRAEKGRACMEFWLGYGIAHGIEIALPQITSLMDTIEDQDEDDVPAYGYDAVKIRCRTDDTGRMRLTMTPRDRLPTAEEVEDAYDHGRPVAEQHRIKEKLT